MEGEVGVEWMHVCIWLSAFALHLKLPQHCSLAILQYKIKKKIFLIKKKKTHAASLIVIILGRVRNVASNPFYPPDSSHYNIQCFQKQEFKMHYQVRITGSTHITIPHNLICLSQKQACQTSSLGPPKKSAFSDALIHTFFPPN